MKKIIYYFFVLLLTSFYLGSCQQDSEEKANERSEQLVLAPFTDVSKLNKQEQQILIKAFSRLTIVKTESGTYVLKQKSGKEVNISENIYNFFSGIIAKTNNRWKKAHSFYTRFGVWDNDSSATDGDNYSTNNDCVIFAIETLLREFGDNTTTAEDIRKKLASLGYYSEDQGTYGSCMESALACYFNVFPVSDMNDFEYGPNDNGKYCVVGRYSIGDNQYDYHAGIVSWAYDGTMIYRDKQWNDTIGDYEASSGMFLRGDVLMLYGLTLK